MTGDNDKPTRSEALAELDDAKGQSYYDANSAFELLYPFAEDATAEFVHEYDPHTETEDESHLADPRTVTSDGSAAIAVSHRVDETQQSGHEARGMVTVWPHQQIITIAEVSGILCEMLGLEDNRGSGIGAGFKADSRHRQNMREIKEHIEEQRAEA